MRSAKVRYNAISGWLPELRMPHSNLLCDWLFPSVFGFRSVRGRKWKKQKHEKVFAPMKTVMRRLNTYMPFVWEEIVRNCIFGRQQRL